MTSHYVPRHRGVAVPLARFSLDVELRLLDVDETHIQEILAAWESAPDRTAYHDVLLDLAKMGHPSRELASATREVLDRSVGMGLDPVVVAELYAHAVAALGVNADPRATLSFVGRVVDTARR